MTSFSDQDLEALDGWLQRRRTGITDIVELEGFLTAIVIGPSTLLPSTWLPRVWGGRQPKFKDAEELNQFVRLVMGLYNDLALWFDRRPEAFEPTFYENKSGGRRVIVVDEWCYGFMKGTRLDAAGWKLLKKERPDLLRPLQLFGTPAGFDELNAGGAVMMHAKWSPRVAPAVRAIHAYWLPHRRASLRPNG